MGDKLANTLIVFIIIVILGLGGMYYVKIIDSHNYPLGEAISIEEEYEETINKENVNNVNTNTTENNEEERITINESKEVASVTVDKTQAGYKYNNRYYYNGLDSYSKAIYDAILREMDNLKKGNQVIEINYDFRVLLNASNGRQELKKYYDDAINALNLDVPNLFYINFSKMFLKVEEITSMFSKKYRLYIDSDEYPNYFADGFNSREEVEAALLQVETIKNRVKSTLQGSDYSKMKALHDWMIDNMEYDLNAPNRASVYGALVEKRGVCESYARTFKYIIDELGIGNVLITGTSTNNNGVTEDHMWNYVQLNGNWYAIDVTWDDPIVVGGGTLSDDIKHRYFLVGSKDLFKNHTEKFTISPSGKIFTPPTLMVNKY